MDSLVILPSPQQLTLSSDVYEGNAISLHELNTYLIGVPYPKNLHRVSSLPENHPNPGTEAYTLIVHKHKVCLHAYHDHGFLYGIQTLRQIVLYYQKSKKPLRQLTIHDWPQFSDRGFMLDVSRNRIPTKPMLNSLLDFLVKLKFNHLELYFEQVFQYKGHEVVWKPFGGISSDDLQWLEKACKERAIELVPNQNSFGHMSHWLEYSNYRSMAEAPNGFTDPWGNQRSYPFSLSPEAEGVEEFLIDLYSQLLPHFSSCRFNVGLDETFDLGQGKSASTIKTLENELIESHQLTADLARSRALGRVYLGMWMRIYQLVHDSGKTMVFWGDIIQNHPELISELPKDILAIEWGYEADHPFESHCKRLKDANIPFLVAPGTCSWNSPSGRYGTAEANIKNGIESAYMFQSQGLLLTDWGDNGHLPPLELSLPAITLAGSASWNYRDRNCSRNTVFGWTGAHYYGDWAMGNLLEKLTTLDETFNLPKIMNTSILGIALVSFENPNYQQYIPFDDLDVLRKLKTYLFDVENEIKTLVLTGRSLLLANLLAQYSAQTLIAFHSQAKNNDKELLLHIHERVRKEFILHWNENFIEPGLEKSLCILDKAVKQFFPNQINSGISNAQ
jgi:hypothetical protein